MRCPSRAAWVARRAGAGGGLAPSAWGSGGCTPRASRCSPRQAGCGERGRSRVGTSSGPEGWAGCGACTLDLVRGVRMGRHVGPRGVGRAQQPVQRPSRRPWRHILLRFCRVGDIFAPPTPGSRPPFPRTRGLGAALEGLALSAVSAAEDERAFASSSGGRALAADGCPVPVLQARPAGARASGLAQVSRVPVRRLFGGAGGASGGAGLDVPLTCLSPPLPRNASIAHSPSPGAARVQGAGSSSHSGLCQRCKIRCRGSSLNASRCRPFSRCCSRYYGAKGISIILLSLMVV